MERYNAPTHGNALEFLAGGGEMGQRIREFDWSGTPLGAVTTWPTSLRTCVQIMLSSRQPYWIGWGKDLVKLYNDPYKAIVGGKHPWALGKPASMVWSDIWKDIEPLLNSVMEKKQGTYVESQLLIMERNGYPEETYYTFSYTPVAGDSGDIEGMICANSDDTERILSERQLKTLTQLGKSFTEAKTNADVYGNMIESLSGNPRDFPFALFYEINEQHATLVKSTQLNAACDKIPRCINLNDATEVSQLFNTAVVERTPQVFNDLQQNWGMLPSGLWTVAPTKAILLPIAQRGQKEAYGILVIGLNPFRLYDHKYESFFALIADQVATSLADVQFMEEERKRLEALAEIDRAKTMFFSNISHEFRTPLTLLLGPIQDALQEPEEIGRNSQRLEVALRNAQRMQKLVNLLLDFSRIEAGKLEVNFAAVDIVTTTEDLVSNFRSAIEKAGMTLIISKEIPSQIAYVDVDMWEKIVLNLVSNAFKYSEKGSIEISIRTDKEFVEISVADTGIGIPESELEKIFERFHRVQNVNGRSQEGTGIGLAMVKELVKLNEGSIAVESTVGIGSKFTVKLPLKERLLSTSNPLLKPSSQASIYINEATQWISGNDLVEPRAVTTERNDNKLYKVLLADDNGDMRRYIHRLLEPNYHVIPVSDGEQAFSKSINEKPDLILADIMMPKLDGFALLKKLKTNLSTRNIPLIFLSARAGEEARVEGIMAGADDYLTKPFSSKELLARVNNHIAISNTRRATEKEFYNLFLQSPAHVHVMKGPDHTFEFFHPLGIPFAGRDITGMKAREALQHFEGQGFFEMLDKVYNEGVPEYLKEAKAALPKANGQNEIYYFNITYLPWRDLKGNIQGVLQFTFDVTEQVESRKLIEESQHKLKNAIELSELGTWNINLTTNFVDYSPRVAEWWGFPEKGASLEAIIEAMHPDDREKAAAAVQQAVKGSGYYQAEYRLINARTKQERYIQASGNVFSDDNKIPVRLTGIVRDVTLYKMNQQELERKVTERTAALQSLNMELSRSNEELQQFAYVASHDLQEPLRKIQVFSEMLKNRSHDHTYVNTYITKIDSSAARMAALIKDVLLFSQVTNERSNYGLVDLNAVISNIKNDFELLITQKQATITSEFIPPIRGNRLQFYQLFSNMIGNSLKFSKADPLIQIQYKIVMGDETMDAKLDTLRKYHCLQLCDNGIGFDPKYAEQIFGLFNRLHNKTDYSGTGIGLAMCKKIVDNHGGAIKAMSAKDEGAVFSIYLPCEE